MTQHIPFRFLTRTDFEKVTMKEFAELETRLSSTHGIVLQVADAVRTWVLDHGIVREEGVRSLQRFLVRSVADPIATYLNAGLLVRGDTIRVSLADGERISFARNVAEAPRAAP